MGHKQIFVILGWVTAVLLGFIMGRIVGAAAVIVVLWLIHRLISSRLVARINCGIRLKVLGAVFIVAVLFFFVSLINFFAMQYMHEEVHKIQDLALAYPTEVIPALDALESTQHGLLFSLTPLLGLLTALVALGLGIAVALSVIDPLRKMDQAMRTIASGALFQPIQIENRDELGELANRINETAKEVVKLQEATLAEERARGLRERIVQVSLAQEEERRRISRELHDGLGPSLAAIGNRLRAAIPDSHRPPAGRKRDRGDHKEPKGHIQEIRGLIYDLRDP